MRTTATLLFLALLLFMGGCAQKQTTLYNFGTYSNSYYAYKQELTAEKSLELQKALEEAIAAEDKGTSGRVPPGMYANLGYLYLKNGNPQKAIESFQNEKMLYPESAHFMDRVIKKVESAEKGDE